MINVCSNIYFIVTSTVIISFKESSTVILHVVVSITTQFFVLQTTRVYFDGMGYCSTPVYLMSILRAGQQIMGPAIVMDQLSTILVEPDCVANVTLSGDLLIDISCSQQKVIDTKLDAIQLSIFSHRFMSIAEQMGR